MQTRFRRYNAWTFAALLLLTAALAIGCSPTQFRKEFSKGLLGGVVGSTSDRVPGVLRPKDRLKILQDRAKYADRATPAEKVQIAGDLAREYHTNDDPHMRRAALAALARYPGKDYEVVLREASGDESRMVRLEACRLWGEQRTPEAAQRLKVLSDDADIDVRLAAIEALGKLGGRESVETLGQILNQRDVAMQTAAVDSLKRATNRDFGNDVGRWKQYVAGQQPDPPRERSVVERMGALNPF